MRKQPDDAGMIGTRDRAAFNQSRRRDSAYWGPAIKKYGITAE